MLNINVNINAIRKGSSGGAVVYKSIVSIAAISDITVDTDVAFDSLGLPTTVQATLSDATVRTLTVIQWQGAYDSSTIATYPLLGALLLPSDVDNPSFLKGHVNVIVASSRPVSSSVALTEDSTDLIVGYVYTSYVGSTEAIQKPIVDDIQITGTLQEDEVGTITIKYKNNSKYAVSSASIKVYKANDIRGGSEALSNTISAGNITVVDDETITATYTWVTGEVGKNICVQASITLAGGTQPTSDIARSLYTTGTVQAAVVVGGITYFGSAANPVDNGTLALATVSVTPPASMQVGDLVIMTSQSRTQVSTHTISQASGQTWNTLSAENMIANSMTVFWCRFNGTWGADPSIAMSGSAVTNSVVMHVFRPTNTSKVWSIDVAEAHANSVVPSGTTVNITGITTIAASTVSFAIWGTADDNTWGTLVGACTVTGDAQYRNLAGSDISTTYAHKIRTTAGITGDVSKTQLTVGADNCITYIMAFKET